MFIVLLCALTVPVENNQNSEQIASATPKLNILIAISSLPSHVTARNVIRSSWGAQAIAAGFDVKFFAGKLGFEPQNQEQLDAMTKEENLIFLRDFVESHDRLATKTMDILSYASAKNFDAVLKVDDTTFVYVDRLVEDIQKHKSTQNLYAGFDATHKEWFRDLPKSSSSRYFVGDQVTLNENKVPPYMHGAGFLVGKTGCDYVRAHRNSLQKLRKDDLAVSMWLETLALDKVEWNVSLFQSQVDGENTDHNVWVSPVSADDMLLLQNKQSISPSVCHKSCLCEGSVAAEEVSACWTRFKESTWKDGFE